MPTGVYEKTEEHKLKLSLALKGREIPSELKHKYMGKHLIGKKLSRETRLKISKAHIKVGPGNYYNIHAYVKKWLGKPDTCVKCNKSGLSGHDIHWANISGEYKRDLTDWVRLCASCHKNYDLGNISL